MLEELHQMCTQITCMDDTRRVDQMVYRYPNRHDGSLWNEEFLLTTQEDANAMVQFFTTNKIKQTEMFVYTEVVEGGVGHSGDGQTSGIHGGSVLYEDHPHQEYQDSTGGISIMMELEVIINPSLHIKKKLNRRIITNKQATSTHSSTTSTKAVLVTTTTITELVKVKVPFMMIIRWKKRSIQVQLVTLRLKKRKAMLVQTASILWKVLMIPVQI
ncbi:unnamed protein product [Linum trigynum]|uniref:Uncharacterized protein n=1 Tax=Linum trigynum TaxID=586398 RepID=A0AAV2CJ97_9ROSI